MTPNTKPFRITYVLVLAAQALMERPDERQWGHDLARRAGVNPNSLYQVLTRMHERGWLADEWENADPAAKRPARRYWTITPGGIDDLRALLNRAAQDRRFAGLKFCIE